MIMANPAQTMPRTRAEKLLGVPSPIPELSSTPQANQMADDKFRASSSVFSALANRNRPVGRNNKKIKI
jgi:hypothetical protein